MVKRIMWCWPGACDPGWLPAAGLSAGSDESETRGRSGPRTFRSLSRPGFDPGLQKQINSTEKKTNPQTLSSPPPLDPSDLRARSAPDGEEARRGRRSRRLLVDILGGEMVAEGFTVDLNKPLVFQVGHLAESYQEWVHQPIVSKEGPRFFENNVLEFLTRTVWWVVPVIWLPVVCWFASMSISMGHSLPQVAIMIMSGISLWTLIEYTLHRFLFHIETKSYWTNTLHYLLHGCHHKHPMDGLRLVFPPAAAAILSVPFYNLIWLMSTPSTAPAIFGGGLLGYVIYDCTHYYLHHGQPSRDPARNLKRYHLNHHFRVQTKGFGITSSLWDNVFGTLPPAPKYAAKSS